MLFYEVTECSKGIPRPRSEKGGIAVGEKCTNVLSKLCRTCSPAVALWSDIVGPPFEETNKFGI